MRQRMEIAAAQRRARFAWLTLGKWLNFCQALLALVALPPVLANLTAITLLALTALPPVLANPTAAALLALLALPPVLARKVCP